MLDHLLCCTASDDDYSKRLNGHKGIKLPKFTNYLYSFKLSPERFEFTSSSCSVKLSERLSTASTDNECINGNGI